MSAEYPPPEIVFFLEVLVTVIHGIALLATTFRLWLRFKMRRFWWEDAWATLALGLDVICVVATWTLVAVDGGKQSHIISLWLTMLSYTCVIWSARMSIVFSIIRIAPPSATFRRLAYAAAVVFFFMWATIFSAKAYLCGANRSWHQDPIIQCPLTLTIALIELCTDLISDIILVAMPLRMLWHVKLPKNQRILILAVFSSSILSCTVSIVHVVFLVPAAGFMAGITADLEGACGLVVCNLLVIVTYFYRVFRNGEDIDSYDSSQSDNTSRTSTVQSFTTVDLSHLSRTPTIQSTALTSVLSADHSDRSHNTSKTI